MILIDFEIYGVSFLIALHREQFTAAKRIMHTYSEREIKWLEYKINLTIHSLTLLLCKSGLIVFVRLFLFAFASKSIENANVKSVKDSMDYEHLQQNNAHISNK